MFRGLGFRVQGLGFGVWGLGGDVKALPRGSVYTTVDDIKTALPYGNYGMFLILGTAGFVSATVPLWN